MTGTQSEDKGRVQHGLFFMLKYRKYQKVPYGLFTLLYDILIVSNKAV